jgi:hypothetical protein
MLREPWLVLMHILVLGSMLGLTAGRLWPAQAQASDGPAPASPYLLGGWGGKRQALEDGGLTFEGTVITEFVVTLRGGRHQGSVVLGNIDLTMALDTAKADWGPASPILAYSPTGTAMCWGSPLLRRGTVRHSSERSQTGIGRKRCLNSRIGPGSSLR